MPSTAAVKATLPFHRHLNPKLWRDESLRPIVRLHLLRTAVAFYDFLDVAVHVSDIVLTGSNAAFNYTSRSDLDVHLLVDFTQTACPDLAETVFLTKKALWSATYDITIRGYPVELYVEDTREPVRASGVYSLLRGDWLRRPHPVAPPRQDRAVAQKVADYTGRIAALTAGSASLEDIRDLMERLHTLRQSGLETGGEFSIENLTYKALRNLGELDRLRHARIKALDDQLSLAERRRG